MPEVGGGEWFWYEPTLNDDTYLAVMAGGVTRCGAAPMCAGLSSSGEPTLGRGACEG